MRPRRGLALELGRGERWQVDGLHGVKEEERPIRLASGVLFEEPDAALEKH